MNFCTRIYNLFGKNIYMTLKYLFFKPITVYLLIKSINTFGPRMIRVLHRQFTTKFGPIMADIGPRTQRMKDTLEKTLSPNHLELINESHMHSVSKNSETHFKVIVVTKDFEGLNLVKRHQKIQSLLREELDTGLHALSIVAKTPEEWDKVKQIEPSPKCLGGFGK